MCWKKIITDCKNMSRMAIISLNLNSKEINPIKRSPLFKVKVKIKSKTAFTNLKLIFNERDWGR